MGTAAWAEKCCAHLNTAWVCCIVLHQSRRHVRESCVCERHISCLRLQHLLGHLTAATGGVLRFQTLLKQLLVQPVQGPDRQGWQPHTLM
jgi:hypothetical protein